jgi:hypothetical protein
LLKNEKKGRRKRKEGEINWKAGIQNMLDLTLS